MSWEDILKKEFSGPNGDKLEAYSQGIKPFREWIEKRGNLTKRTKITREWIPESVSKKALELLNKLKFVNNQKGSEGNLTADVTADENNSSYYIETAWYSSESEGGSLFIQELSILPNQGDGGILCDLGVELFVDRPLKEMSDKTTEKHSFIVNWRSLLA